MPTSTFFRLPEEKRGRLLAAAWQEFTAASFPDVSINKIILKARIPRGSFYQYFTDKEDLFSYLCQDLHSYLVAAIEDALRTARGDLFSASVCFYDHFCRSIQCPEPSLTRCIQLCRLNPDMHLRKVIHDLPGLLLEPFWELIDTSRFRRTDFNSLRQVFLLLTFATVAAAASTLAAPERRESHRQLLLAHIDIIKHGSLSAAAVPSPQ